MKKLKRRILWNFICSDFYKEPFALRIAFTMAEILISLTIIGVIAALMLPALLGNINERIWNTQRNALLTRISQAMSMIPSLNGFGEYEATYSAESKDDCKNRPHGYCNDSVSVIKDTAAMAFVTDGLSKVMKLNNICDKDHLEDCGISSTYKTAMNETKTIPHKLSDYNKAFIARPHVNGDSVEADIEYAEKYAGVAVNTQVVGVETLNGESMVVLYNPKCVSGVSNQEARFIINNYHEPMVAVNVENRMWQHLYRRGYIQNSHATSTMCVTFLYDLNGKKGPNKIYKDMGAISAFYPVDTKTVGPVLTTHNVPHPNKRNASESLEKYKMTFDKAAKACELEDKNSRLMTVEELEWIGVNYGIVSDDQNSFKYRTFTLYSNYWGGADSIINNDYAWEITRGILTPKKKDGGPLASQANGSIWLGNVRCVKK